MKIRASGVARSRRRREEAISAAIVLAGGTRVYAEVVVFENDGSFDWASHAGCLDITDPPDLQGACGSAAGFNLGSYIYCGSLPYGEYVCGYYCGDPPYGLCCYNLYLDGCAYQNSIAGVPSTKAGLMNQALIHGDPIGPGNSFQSFISGLNTFCEDGGSCQPVGLGGDEPFFLGARITVVSNLHNYGWIKVQKVGGTLQALAWGYETTFNTPIEAGAGLSEPPPPPACPTDLNGNGVTDSPDLNLLLTQFGLRVDPGAGADFDADGAVGSTDLNSLLADFGDPCP